MYVILSIHIYVHTYAFTHSHTHAHTHMYQECGGNRQASTRRKVWASRCNMFQISRCDMYVCIYIYICACIYIEVSIYLCQYVFIYVYVYDLIHTHTCIFMYTYTQCVEAVHQRQSVWKREHLVALKEQRFEQRQASRHWWQFSKVSSLLNLRYKIVRELTFENFDQIRASSYLWVLITIPRSQLAAKITLPNSERADFWEFWSGSSRIKPLGTDEHS